jgi:ribose 5-phosphate isomerase A
MPVSSGGTPRIAERALEFVREGTVIGLGTGRAATAFVHALGDRVQAGLHVRGVPTSQATAGLARQLGIPLTTLDEAMPLDVAIDGADEVSASLDLIKGLGGALVREKIVAAAARRLVILADKNKCVQLLGEYKKKLPVEVVPFGLALCRQRLADLGYPADLRVAGDQPFVTDNGNVILDCRVAVGIHDPAGLDEKIRALPGVVGTGLFLGMADVVLIEAGDTVEERQRKRP